MGGCRLRSVQNVWYVAMARALGGFASSTVAGGGGQSVWSTRAHSLWSMLVRSAKVPPVKAQAVTVEAVAWLGGGL